MFISQVAYLHTYKENKPTLVYKNISIEKMQIVIDQRLKKKASLIDECYLTLKTCTQFFVYFKFCLLFWYALILLHNFEYKTRNKSTKLRMDAYIFHVKCNGK